MTNKTVLSVEARQEMIQLLINGGRPIDWLIDRVEQALLQSPEIQQDRMDAARYRAWRQAATNNRREFIEAAEKYENSRGKGKLTEAEFDAGIDAGIAAMEQKP